MGNVVPIAYGGHVTAQAFIAAYHSLGGDLIEKEKWVIYSANGNFLGPTTLDRPVRYRVEKPRNTRTFATRHVTASQLYEGKERNCFIVTFDFTLRIPGDEPVHQQAKLPLSYSIEPPTLYPPPEEVPFLMEDAAQRLKQGEITKKQYEILYDTFELGIKVAHFRLIKDQVFSDSLMGIAPKENAIEKFAKKGIATLRQADYLKSNDPLTEIKADDDVLPISAYFVQAAFLIFVGDEALAFLALMWHGLGLMEAGVASTLDFSVRFLTDDFNFEEPHLREYRTYAGRHERTFSDGLIWDKHGRLVAAISQTCINRPKKSHM